MSPNAWLGRLPMYRVVTLGLVAITAVALVLAATGEFIEPLVLRYMIPSLILCIAVSLAANSVCGLVVRRRVHHESALITGLIVFLIFWPPTTALGYAWLTLALVAAQVSKYVIAWRGRHVLNPAAAGAFVSALVQEVANIDPGDGWTATWWVAAEVLFPVVVLAGLAVALRTQKLGPVLLLIVAAGGLSTMSLLQRGTDLEPALRMVLFSFPIVYLAFFMFTEPLTLPARRVQQYVVAIVLALLLAGPQLIGTFVDFQLPSLLRKWETLLLLANLLAFGFARRAGIDLRLVSQRAVSESTREFVFRSRRRLRWVPGQYLELDVPHRRPDRRGSRRMISFASEPRAGEVRIAMKVPETCSSFKRALGELPAGAKVHATGVWGDFTLPRDADAPVLAVAGGIGITPFLAQAQQLRERDAVLIYGAPSSSDAPYLKELAGVRGILVTPDAPPDLPAGWTHVRASAPTAAVLAEAVPDLAQRHAFVSGPPRMVSAVRGALAGPWWTLGLRRRAKSVKTDSFAGY